MTERPSVIVVGAGPVGAVTALASARAGFTVTLLDAAEQVNNDPRAATFHPSTIEMLALLGIVDKFIAAGIVSRYFDYWDKPARKLVARMDHDVLSGETKYPFVVQTEQHKLVNIVLDELRQLPNVTVRLGESVTAISQDANSTTAVCATDGTQTQYTADWLVGADGGRSFVRKALDIEFEGYTWPERFIVLTSTHDFESNLGCSYRSYFADPAGWANLFKVAGDDYKGRWRAVFAAGPDETDEEALGDESALRRLGPLLDGAPAQLVHRNIYRVHQRVAKAFRSGRIFLAGDAAHVNNPIGGLGLNCGIHDATELVETLTAVVFGGEDADLLNRYERRRRTLNIEFVQQQTVANKKRLEETDPEVRAQRLQDLADIAGDENRMRQFLRRTSLLESVEKAKAID